MNRLHRAIEVAVACTVLGVVVITPLLMTKVLAEPEHQESNTEQVVEGYLAPPPRTKMVKGRDPAKPKPFILDETTCPGNGCFCISSYDDKGNLTEVKCSEVKREEEVQ